MEFSLTHEGRHTPRIDYKGALALNYPAAVAGAALKTAAEKAIADFAETKRAALATVKGGKLAEYRIKEEIARDPDGAIAEELALIDREAAARGMDRDGLLALITARTVAYRQIALLVAAMEAETTAAIAAIPDSAADIEAQIDAIFTAAMADADEAFADALALINGGS